MCTLLKPFFRCVVVISCTRFRNRRRRTQGAATRADGKDVPDSNPIRIGIRLGSCCRLVGRYWKREQDRGNQGVQRRITELVARYCQPKCFSVKDGEDGLSSYHPHYMNSVRLQERKKKKLKKKGGQFRLLRTVLLPVLELAVVTRGLLVVGVVLVAVVFAGI